MATYFLSAFIPCLIPLRYQRRTGDVGMGFECESRFQEFPFLQLLTISDFMSQLAYHVPHVLQIDRVRASLYTGWDNRCVGSPSILTDLPTNAILALEPKGGSSSAAFTIRNSKTLLTLPIPIISQSVPRCATHRSHFYRVLGTLPLPAAHPRFGNR